MSRCRHSAATASGGSSTPTSQAARLQHQQRRAGAEGGDDSGGHILAAAVRPDATAWRLSAAECRRHLAGHVLVRTDSGQREGPSR